MLRCMTRVRLLAAVCVVAIAVAAVCSIPALALPALLVATIAAALFAARIARPEGARRSHLRTAVVLGAVAYLAGLPVTWLAARHVDAVAGARAESWTTIALAGLLASFVVTFTLAGRLRTK